MSKRKFELSERLAIWEAHTKKCFYCGEPIAFFDLEIDHIIPEELAGRPSDLASVITNYELPSDFSVNDYENLVPSHHDCNRRKGDELFPKSRALFFLQLAQSKAEIVRKKIDQQQKLNSAHKVFAQLNILIEKGVITTKDVQNYIQMAATSAPFGINNPIVVRFMSTDPNFLNGKPYLPYDQYNALFWGELEDLFMRLREKFDCKLKIVDDARDAEDAWVGIALWDPDIDKLTGLDLGNWRIVNVALYSELYRNYM